MKNLRTIEKSAKSKEEAIKLALLELGLDEENAKVEIIEEGSRGLFGLGSKDALVRVSPDVNLEKRAEDFLNEYSTNFIAKKQK